MFWLNGSPIQFYRFREYCLLVERRAAFAHNTPATTVSSFHVSFSKIFCIIHITTGMQNAIFGEALNPLPKLRACDRAVELVVRDVIP